MTSEKRVVIEEMFRDIESNEDGDVRVETAWWPNGRRRYVIDIWPEQREEVD